MPIIAWIPGPLEMVIVGVISVLLFGHRLPGAMRSLGRSVVEFKKGVRGVGDDSEKTDGDGGRIEQKTREPS